MKVSRTGLAIAIVGLAGCGGYTSATAPSATRVVTTAPPPPPNAGVPAMKGTVSDGAFRPIPGVRIEVLDGPQTGATTTSDGRGEFSFSGTIDDSARFRATSDGYLPSVETLGPPCASCNPQRWVHFAMEAVAPSIDMAGNYTVTFASACDSLPNDLRRRTYGATIRSAPYHDYPGVSLTTGTFVKGYDSLPLGVEGDYVAFWIEILVEQVAPNSYLIVNGLAAAHVGTQAKATYTFPLDGSITYCRTQDDGSFDDCLHHPASSVECPSVQLSLTRR